MRSLCFLFGSLLLIATASIVNAAELPERTRGAIVCLYNALSSQPSVLGLTVYVDVSPNPKLIYWYLRRDISLTTVEIRVGGPNARGRFVYWDATSSRDNPIARVTNILAKKCKADEISVVQSGQPPVKIIELAHSRLIDMSKYSH